MLLLTDSKKIIMNGHNETLVIKIDRIGNKRIEVTIEYQHNDSHGISHQKEAEVIVYLTEPRHKIGQCIIYKDELPKKGIVGFKNDLGPKIIKNIHSIEKNTEKLQMKESIFQGKWMLIEICKTHGVSYSELIENLMTEETISDYPSDNESSD